MIDDDDRALLLAASEDRRIELKILTTQAAYACCGRGWQERSGYEQIYQGQITSLSGDTLRLVRRGIGTLTYTVIVPVEALVDVEAV